MREKYVCLESGHFCPCPLLFQWSKPPFAFSAQFLNLPPYPHAEYTPWGSQNIQIKPYHLQYPFMAFHLFWF